MPSTVADPLLREAIELNAFEEGRHKQVLSNLVAAYGITLAPEPRIRPRRATRNGPSWSPASASASTASSPSACSRRPSAPDSFRRRWSTPSSRSCRRRRATSCSSSTGWPGTAATMPLWRRPWFELQGRWRCGLFLIWERIGIARDVGERRSGQQLHRDRRQVRRARHRRCGAARLCLAENDRRMSVYDKRLLRPAVVPRSGSVWRAVSCAVESGRRSARYLQSVKLRTCPVAVCGVALGLYLVMYVGWRAVLSAAIAIGWGGFALFCRAHSLSSRSSVRHGTSCCRAKPAPGLRMIVRARMVRDAATEVLPFSQSAAS